MKIIHENILKVLDIHYSQFSKDFIGFIAKQQPTYKDRVLGEDIFSPDQIREDNEVIPPQVESELMQLSKLMYANDCGYFRIIYT